MLTLKELKKVVKVAGMTKRVPSEKALEKEEIVVKEILSGECDITQMGMCYTGKTERKPSFHSIPVKIINTWM